jgi:hypothetical protein
MPLFPVRWKSGFLSQGAEFQVNSYTTFYQYRPSVAAVAGGGFVVAWASYGTYGTDSSHFAIEAQRYQVPSAPAVPAMSSAMQVALGATLLLLGALYALRRR